MAESYLSQADYAKHRGVSKQAVGKMVAGGKIPTHMVGGRRMIDAAEADFALGESRARISYVDDDAPTSSRKSSAPLEPAATSGLTKARTETEVYNAKMAELRYRREVGELLPVDGVRRAMEHCAATMVRAIDQLPTHADDLASAFTRGGPGEVRKHLKTLAKAMRQALSDSMRLTAESDTDEGGDV